jgi:ABC-type phosphate/phosphonate transport system substrate-binding protein
VLDGIVDAGASFANDTINIDNAWHQFLKNKDDVNKFRVIHYTDPIPGDVVACLTSMKEKSPEKITLITEKLLKISGEALGQRLIKKLNRTDSLLPAKIEPYNAVREASKLVIID